MFKVQSSRNKADTARLVWQAPVSILSVSSHTGQLHNPQKHLSHPETISPNISLIQNSIYVFYLVISALIRHHCHKKLPVFFSERFRETNLGCCSAAASSLYLIRAQRTRFDTLQPCIVHSYKSIIQLRQFRYENDFPRVFYCR